jgi:hypothetical protein
MPARQRRAEQVWVRPARKLNGRTTVAYWHFSDIEAAGSNVRFRVPFGRQREGAQLHRRCSHKTHLQHIYGKTGTSKQTELLHLFMSSTPPVRVA